MNSILAVFEKFIDIDIETTTLSDIVEMLKEKRNLALPKTIINETKSSTEESDQYVRILLAAKDHTKLENNYLSEVLFDSSNPDPDGTGVPSIATVLEKIGELNATVQDKFFELDCEIIVEQKEVVIS